MNDSLFNRYLTRHQVVGDQLLAQQLVPDIIVVIPCFDEPNIISVLECLRHADRPVNVEVIVVVNSGEMTSETIVHQNLQTYQYLQIYAQKQEQTFVVTPLLLEGIRRKDAGVGYARKRGMDMAIWRWASLGASVGIIASLDADSLVAENYFSVLWAFFQNTPKSGGAVLRFEHALGGDDFDDQIYVAIAHYELHLRYVNQALKWTGFPYAFHTIGSAFAVRAEVYVKAGGMNRRQGGEDFYFLHKLFPNYTFHNLNETCVYPSPRPSHRVPFGTGPRVQEFTQSNELLTYSWDAFEVLRLFFAEVDLLYNSIYKWHFHPVMMDFLKNIDFENHLLEIRNNTATQAQFVKRFFAYFNAFQVVKFLNFAHQSCFLRSPIEVESKRALLAWQDDVSCGVKELLLHYRNIEGR